MNTRPLLPTVQEGSRMNGPNHTPVEAAASRNAESATSAWRQTTDSARHCGNQLNHCFSRVESLRVDDSESLSEEQMKTILSIQEYLRSYEGSLQEAGLSWSQLSKAQQLQRISESPEQIDNGAAPNRMKLRKLLVQNALSWVDASQRTIDQSIETWENSRKVMEARFPGGEPSDSLMELLIASERDRSMIQKAMNVSRLGLQTLERSDETGLTPRREAFQHNLRRIDEASRAWQEAFNKAHIGRIE
ncbi:hypothetical protein I302_105666 [Kwoniella bestiolae CBS 10118]|uniref:Uncharacterized protein n=1 Tax=Kwoniella bestiolae CBS 10118 TaxID=1296100 RepID=A0A1B9G1S8_9TREE|nr:hypothetical protein I302_04784 [Kwoniella bestiolae CBS 10118]OCF24974.1 hypothetical protein I302_04784 [Kwoniella bestiolae CBS 10118]